MAMCRNFSSHYSTTGLRQLAYMRKVYQLRTHTKGRSVLGGSRGQLVRQQSQGSAVGRGCPSNRFCVSDVVTSSPPHLLHKTTQHKLPIIAQPCPLKDVDLYTQLQVEFEMRLGVLSCLGRWGSDNGGVGGGKQWADFDV